MGSKSPVFPIPEPQHFSDYGFDPQIDYFQAKKHKRWEDYCPKPPIETIHFKLQKPISKDDAKKSKKRKWWFKNAILYLKSKWQHSSSHSKTTHYGYADDVARTENPSSISGPIYVTESRSGSSTPYRNARSKKSSRSPSSAGTMKVAVPYFSLKELNMGEAGMISSSSSSPTMPIYLVT